jgi:hypothetical protein
VTSRRLLAVSALGLLLLAFLALYTGEIWDPDLWWHLATGRHIVATGSIPSVDPFGVYTQTDPRALTILRCYWVMQVLLYGAAERLGIAGIIALRAAFLLGCLVVLHRRATALAHAAPSFLVVALAGLTLASFTNERPQLASFLLAGLVFLFLDRYEEEGREAWLYSVPATMLLWANCHGGVVLGAVLLLVYGAARIGTRWSAWAAGARRERNVFLTVMAVSLVLTLASPAGWNPFITVVQLEGTEFKHRVSEYASPLQLWRSGMFDARWYAALLALAFPATLALLRDRQFGRAALVVLLGALSAGTYRYIPFFVLVAGPYVASGLARLAARVLPSERLVHAVVAFGAATALVIGIRDGSLFQGGVRQDAFPAGAVEELRSRGATGKMLSSFEWGGYVLWELGGRVRPYMDSRNLDMEKFARYTNLIWATPVGLRIFEDERFDLVLLPRGNRFTGEEYPLHRLLLLDPRWRLAREDANGRLFVSVRP